MLKIALSSPEQPRQDITLTQAEYILGRDPDSTIVLNGGKVSRKHARIYRSAEIYFVEDLGSANGVLVNRTRISTPTKLAKDDIVQVGNYRIDILNDTMTYDTDYILIGQTAPCKQQRFPVPKGLIDIGRVGSNAFAIDHQSISRNHARISCDANAVVIQDNGSSNGTWVNNKRIENPMELRHGDMIRFGKVEFLFSQNESSAQPLLLPGNGIWTKLKLPVLGSAIVLMLLGLGLFFFKQTSNKSNASLYEQALASQIAQAEIFSKQEDWNGAKQIYAQILAQDPLNENVQQELKYIEDTLEARALLNKGLEFFNQNELNKADLILKNAPTNTPYEAALAQLKSNVRIKKEMTMLKSPEEQSHVFATQYPDTEIKQAALYYSQDKIDDAINHVRKYLARAGASRLHRKLIAIRKLYKGSLLHEKNKSYLLATGSLQSIVAFDQEIIPKSCNNLFRQKIRNKLSNMLLYAGNAAWENKAYEKAYQAWHKGFATIPWDNRFAKGFAQLDSLAKEKLVALGLHHDVHDKQSCSQLVFVTQITQPSSMYYRQAQAELKKCPSP